MEKLDPVKEKFDFYIVDGASNVQVAGNLIEAYFLRVSVMHGSEHCITLAFNDIAEIPPISGCAVACSFLLIAGSTFLSCSQPINVESNPQSQTTLPCLWIEIYACTSCPVCKSSKDVY